MRIDDMQRVMRLGLCRIFFLFALSFVVAQPCVFATLCGGAMDGDEAYEKRAAALQMAAWVTEHSGGNQAIPSHNEMAPASSAVSLLKSFRENGCTQGTVVDMGAGKGRNSVFFAQNGFNVVSLEYVPVAAQRIRDSALSFGLGDRIEVHEADVTEKWPLDSGSVAAVIDSYASIDIPTASLRKRARDEGFRVLRKGGLLGIAVVSIEDPWESELHRQAEFRGAEPNSVFWPDPEKPSQPGKFQKDYTQEELVGFYQEAGYRLVEIKEIRKTANKRGRTDTAVNFLAVFTKP